MTKIILVGDIHVSDVSPRMTFDSYTDDIIDMLRWVNEYAKSTEADAVIWAGDVFDKKQANRNSHRLVQKMIDLIQSSEVPIWCVTGNHDVTNDRLDSLESQPLGVLYRSGLNELDGWHPELPVYGVPWQQYWDDPIKWTMAFESYREDLGHLEVEPPKLIVTHASIFPKGKEPIYEYLDLDDLAIAMRYTGSLYYGHIHDYHGFFEHEGVTFGNVGAISRGSLTESHITRDVKIAIWEDGKFSEVSVGNQRPASEVLRISEGAEKKELKLDLDAFLADVDQSTLDISSTSSIISHVQSLDDVEPRIKKRAIAIVEQVS